MHNEARTLTIIDERTASEIATRDMAREAVRRAFIAYAEGKSELFPVAIGEGPLAGSMIAIKSGRSGGATGLKVGTYWPGNEQHGLANHAATSILLDPRTGAVSAIVNATALNGMRTAAADAIAVDALSRKDADTLAIIGTGHQALHDVRAILDVRAIAKIRLWNRSTERARTFAGKVSQFTDASIEVYASSPDAAAAGADIVVTATPSDAPLITGETIAPGAHISAMGADKAGKQEIDRAFLSRTRLFADSPEQACRIGEFQHAAAAGDIEPKDITPIGLVLSGAADGRRNDSEITVFDSSGIASQDIEVAAALVDAAKRASAGNNVVY